MLHSMAPRLARDPEQIYSGDELNFQWHSGNLFQEQMIGSGCSIIAITVTTHA